MKLNSFDHENQFYISDQKIFLSFLLWRGHCGNGLIMEDGYMKTWQQCCDYFGVNVDRGLSSSEVKKNLEKYGPNGE